MKSFIRTLLLILTSVYFLACEKEESGEKFDTDLLTSVIWGEFDICGTESDPDVYTWIFKPGGQLLKYKKIYQSIYGGTWRLKDNETIVFLGDEYKIVTLDKTIMKIRPVGGLCVSTFQAKAITEASTIGVTSLSQTSARLHGFIRTCTPTRVFFEYGTTTSYGQTIEYNTGLLAGPSSSICSIDIAGLLPGTTYYYRIKAQHEDGTKTYYGQDMRFITYNSLTVTDHDNNTYNTITIGEEIWFAENLKTTKYNDGSAIPPIKDNTVWKDLNSPAYCWYENDSLTYMDRYGALYNWYAVNTGKLCPDGWHMPDELEWLNLFEEAGQEAGIKLNEGSYDLPEPLLYSDPLSRSEPSNESGFSARWTGVRSSSSEYYAGFCVLWSDNEDNTDNARIAGIKPSYVYTGSRNKKYGIPVRCVKDH